MFDVLNAIASYCAKNDKNNFIIHFKELIAPNDSIAVYVANYKLKGGSFPRSLEIAYKKRGKTSR